MLFRSESDRFLALGENLAEADPARAVEAHELHLFDRKVIGRTGGHADSRKQHRQFRLIEAGRLPQHVLAREVVAALAQHVHHGLRSRVPIDDKEVRQAGAVQVFFRPSKVILHAFIIEPLVL